MGERQRVVGLDITTATLADAAERGLLPVRAQVEATLPFASGTFATVVLGRSTHNVEFDAGPGTSGHIRYDEAVSCQPSAGSTDETRCPPGLSPRRQG